MTTPISTYLREVAALRADVAELKRLWRLESTALHSMWTDQRAANDRVHQRLCALEVTVKE